MSELNNYQVKELSTTELLKIEGGLMVVSKKVLQGLAFAAGFIVGFVEELAS